MKCTKCGKQLTGEEASVYEPEWQKVYGATFYCVDHRSCPDDCRRIPCVQSMREWYAKKAQQQ